MRNERVMNYLGQLRPYSAIDLALQLQAARCGLGMGIGSLVMWAGFLIYLEVSHAHPGRLPFPRFLPWIAWIAAIPLFPWKHGAAFVLLSLLYARKSAGWWGLAAPAVRGGQSALLMTASPLCPPGYAALSWALIALRNALGDLRDVEKDCQAGMLTWPIAMGIRAGRRHVHLVAVWLTTASWWWLGGWGQRPWGWAVLAGAWAAEGATYGLTLR